MKGNTEHNDSQDDSFVMLSVTNKPFMLCVVVLNAVTLSVAALTSLFYCHFLSMAQHQWPDSTPQPSDDGASVLPLC